MKQSHLMLVLALACFGVSMGADAATTTVLGADPALWDTAGLSAIVLYWLWPTVVAE